MDRHPPRARRLLALAISTGLWGSLATPWALAEAATPSLQQIPPVVDPQPIVVPIPTPITTPTPAPLAPLASPAPALSSPTSPAAQPASSTTTPGPGSAPVPGVPGPANDPAATTPSESISNPADFKPTAQEAVDLPDDPDRLYYEGQQLILTNEFAQFEHDFGQAALQAGGGAGSFGSPLISNRQIIVTQLFGCTEFGLEPYNPGCSSRHWHTGIDWGAPAGMPVFAADAGVVRLFRDPGGYGNHAVVVHGNGFVTLYGHLQGFAVRDGQVVRRGEMIGQVGSSGFSTGSHLHFEIRHDNVYLDPCVYLGCLG